MKPWRGAPALPLGIPLLLLAWTGMGCSSRESGQAERAGAEPLRDGPVQIEVAAARALPSPASMISSYLEPEREAELVAETAGEIREIRVREGTWVAEGETLLVIDDRDERLALKRDEAELEWSQAQYRRVQSLVETGHSSPREEEEARLNVSRSEAALGLSQMALSRCAVRAPIAGLAWMIRVEPLHHVAVGTTLLRVTDPSRLRATAYLPASLRRQVRVGQAIRLEPVSGGAPIHAVVGRVDPLTDPASGTFKVVATVRRQASHPEAGAEVRMVLPGANGASPCLVPLGTLMESDGDSTWVWRREGNRVRRSLVQLGPVRRDAIQIDSGLPPGTEVVTGTSRPLEEGTVVAVAAGR